MTYPDQESPTRTAPRDVLTAPRDVLAELGDPDAQGTRLWELCSWLRTHDPVHRAAKGNVVISRYEDVARVLNHPDLGVPEVAEIDRLYDGAVQHRALSIIIGNMAMTNPPRHTGLRRVAARGFTPRSVGALRDSATRTCESLVAALARRLGDGETVDFYATFAEAFALDVISDLVGVPEADRPWMSSLVREMLVFANPAVARERLVQADRVLNTMADYLRELTTQRRRAPRDDLISAWASGHGADADRLGEEELLCMVWLVWMAGFETSAAAIANSVVSMIEHPEAAGWFDRGGVKGFIDESLRYDPPVLTAGVLRVAATDVVLGESSVIERGSRVCAVIGAANHDPAVYPDPERFDPSRDQAPSLSFGRGVHNCLGMALARLELEIALPLVRRRLPGLRLAEEPRRRGGLPIRTFARVAVAQA
jgi:cytochrome P450